MACVFFVFGLGMIFFLGVLANALVFELSRDDDFAMLAMVTAGVALAIPYLRGGRGWIYSVSLTKKLFDFLEETTQEIRTED